MKTHDIRLLCLDIDGTLLDSKHELPPENRAAVQYANRCGVTVCLMSARPPKAVFPIWDALGVPGPIACCGGGLILSGKARLADCRIPPQTVLRVIEETARQGVHLSVYRDMDWFIDRADDWSAAESAITGIAPTVTLLAALAQGWTDGAHKLLCMGAREQIDELFAALAAQRLPIELLRSKDEYLEIVPEKTGKQTAMQTLCRALDLSAAQVMAMGDHDIDAPLLRAAGYGVAMANASEAAKRAARYHTGTNDQAGVAQAIYRWIGEETHL